MEIILERDERYSFYGNQLNADWTLEHAKLKARLEVLQKNQRHLMVEDPQTATLRDLHNLEQQLNSTLKHRRSKRVSVLELQNKDKALQKQNNLLHKKLKEEKEMMSQQWRQQQQQLRDYVGPNTSSSSSSSILPHTLQSLSLSGSESGEVLQAAKPAAFSLDALHPELMTL